MPQADDAGDRGPRDAAEPADEARGNPLVGLGRLAGDVVRVVHQVSAGFMGPHYNKHMLVWQADSAGRVRETGRGALGSGGIPGDWVWLLAR